MNSLTTRQETFTPDIKNRGARNVWKWFDYYQGYCGLSLAQPNFQGFVDWQLSNGKKPSTVNTYLNHLRGVYHDLLIDNQFVDWVISQASGNTLAERVVIGNQILAGIRNALAGVHVKVVTIQDRDDRTRRWLTKKQQSDLISRPYDYGDNLIAHRDSALFDLMLATGIRAAEATALQVSDLRGKYNGHLALLVQAGKGNKQRLIPYGASIGVVEHVESWLTLAGITDGPVFRQINKGGKVGGALNHQTITDWILPQYPIWIESEQTSVIVKAHDLRRSYARGQYEAGMKLEALQANLGHSDLKTTLHYVGELNGDDRAGR